MRFEREPCACGEPACRGLCARRRGSDDSPWQAFSRRSRTLPIGPRKARSSSRTAARLGGAEAAAQLAVLSAIGMFVDQSWEGGARRAHVFGRARLVRRRNGSCASWPPIVSWLLERAIPRAGGSLQPRSTSAGGMRRYTGATLSESPLVRHFPGFASAEVCEWLIEKSRGRLVRASVYSQQTRKEKISETRTNTWAMFNVLEADLVSVLVQVRMCANTGVPFRYLEPLSVLHYAVGEADHGALRLRRSRCKRRTTSRSSRRTDSAS